jgi:hypothetical protein
MTAFPHSTNRHGAAEAHEDIPCTRLSRSAGALFSKTPCPTNCIPQLNTSTIIPNGTAVGVSPKPEALRYGSHVGGKARM